MGGGVVVSLPKFKFDTDYDMDDVLSIMGMPTTFSPDNAFTGMYDKLKLEVKIFTLD